VARRSVSTNGLVTEETPTKVKPNRYRIWRLLNFARPYWWQLAGLTLLTFITSALTLVYPAFTVKIIDSVIQKNQDALHSIIFTLIALALVQGIVGFIQSFWTTAVGERVLVDLRTKVYGHLQQLPLSFFQDNRTGELLSRLTNDVTLVRGTITGDVVSLAQNLITLLLGVVIVIAGPDALLAQASQLNIHLPTTHSTASFGPTLLVIALILGSLAMVLAGSDPIEGFSALLAGALGTPGEARDFVLPPGSVGGRKAGASRLRAARSAWRIGFVTKSSMPAARQRSRSPSIA